MDRLATLLPSAEKGYLPYYLLLVSVVAMGNAVQGFSTLHYTRRIYNGLFVANASLPPASADDSVAKLVPTTTGTPRKDATAARDQVTPLAARLFGVYTFLAGLVRFYACYDLGNRYLYEMAIWTHVVAAAHFTSELVVYKTLRFSGPQVFPFMAAFGGTMWMVLQYHNYVE